MFGIHFEITVVMKNLLLLIITALSFTAQGQTLISSFTFDSTTSSGLMKAAVGANAISIHANVASNGDCAYVSPSGGSVGIDLTVPSTQFKTNSLSMFFDYTRRESQANFFELGDMALTMNGGNISISFAVNENGTKVVRTYNNFYTLGAVGTSYVLAFSYDAASGKFTFNVNGTDVYSVTGNANASLDWTAAGANAIIGRLMDGSGSPTLCGFRMYGSAMALPVTWLEVKSTRIENDIVINWKTASEINNSHFEVERSLDGLSFHKIGQINGAGNSNTVMAYEFVDMNAAINAQSSIYYRIKQIDFDGKFEYSISMMVSNRNTNDIKVFPSLLTSGTKINITGLDREISSKVLVMDTQGQIVYSSDSDDSILEITTSKMKKGMYYVIIESDNASCTNKIFIQ